MTAALAFGLTIAAAPGSQAAPPTDPSCLPLIAGATGLPFISGSIPAASDGLGAPADKALPRRVWLKSGQYSVATDQAFAVADHRLYAVRARGGVPVPGAAWRKVVLPSCLDGHIQSISADGSTLVAIGAGRQVYTNDLAGGGVPTERWTWRWGPFLWTGLGFTLPQEATTAAYSDFSSAETFTDSAGRRHHPIGVGTYYLLEGAGTRIVPLDPWLPIDESRAVCLPEQGRARVANLDASGSTVLAATRSGRLYTRLYDFDVSGANAIFGSYTWQQGLASSDKRWQLPVLDWRRQPKPPGTITDAVSIVRTGTDARDRQLRVAGRRHGRNGVWTKPIDARRWTFTPVAGSLLGRRLPLKGTTYAPATTRFEGTLGGARTVIRAFDWACTPTTMEVQVAPKQRLALRLWAYDGLRQSRQSRGLTDTPRFYNAAIEVPAATWKALRGPPRDWVRSHLSGRITPTHLAVTATRLSFRDQCWKLTRDGRPARPDKPALPPDVGVTLGDLQAAGGNPASALPLLGICSG